MKRRKALVILVIAVVALVAAFAFLLPRNGSENTVPEEVTTFDGIVAEYRGTEYCEIIVDFGSVKRSTTVHETIRLTNLSDSPIVLLDYSTQCRCMWLEFERTPIAPNESKDIVLTFDSRGEWGSVGNFMEITTSIDSAPIVIWIGAEIE